MELFKNLYNDHFFEFFTQALSKVYPAFNKSVFLDHIYDSEWDSRELKQRMRHITESLRKQMPNNFIEATDVIQQCINLRSISVFQRSNFLSFNSVQQWCKYAPCFSQFITIL